jgi:hypothetical protein
VVLRTGLNSKGMRATRRHAARVIETGEAFSEGRPFVYFGNMGGYESHV